MSYIFCIFRSVICLSLRIFFVTKLRKECNSNRSLQVDCIRLPQVLYLTFGMVLVAQLGKLSEYEMVLFLFFIAGPHA